MATKRKQENVSVETFGLSQREFLTLFLLHELQKSPGYPADLHQKLKETYTGKVHSYDYLCKVARQLAESGDLQLIKETRKKYYSTTAKGDELYKWYQENFKVQLIEVKKVIDRFVYDLTGSGTYEPVKHELPQEHRHYFSKMVSVMDLVRYVTLKAAAARKHVYMGEIAELLKTRYGWISSKGYLYDLASEMEATDLLIGQWEGERRTKRYLKITDEGIHHYKQIADSAAYRVKEIQHYLQQILSMLNNRIENTSEHD
ncbi:hypothetical protein [Metabacillus fastidiosus]|uniref:hypothetical protein n=1 Tax=Metabacillus fastidiosus TaxID=1458 RepID=UPI003D2A4793